MQKYPAALILIVTLALITLGCANPPTEEMEAAKAAVRAARDSGADVYASDEFSDATKALANAETSVATKKYEEARNSAIQAKQKAEQAQQSAIQNKAAAKAKANAAIAEADANLTAAADTLAGAPVGKGTEEDIQQLNYDLEEARSLLATARQKVESEDYNAAVANAQSVSEQASSIQEAVRIAKENFEKAKEKAPWWMSIK